MKTPGRRGFLVFEAIMALALAVALTVTVAQLLTVVMRQRRMMREQVVAMQEAGNMMEHLVAGPWEETTPGPPSTLELSDDGRSALPDARLAVEVADEGAGAKRISVEVRWQGATGRPDSVLRLVGWQFRPQEDSR